MKQKIYLCVLHSSVAKTWLSRKLASESTDKILDYLRVQPALVPAIWHQEMADFMLLERDEAALSEQGMKERIGLLLQLPIHTDDTAYEKVIWSLLKDKAIAAGELSHALYIELAKKHEAPLVTIDANLAEAAKKEGIAVLP